MHSKFALQLSLLASGVGSVFAQTQSACPVPISFADPSTASCTFGTVAQVYTCTFLATNTITIAAGADVQSITVRMEGGKGYTAAPSVSGGSGTRKMVDVVFPKGVLAQPLRFKAWVNANDQSNVRSLYGGGGGGYSAFGDADCAEANAASRDEYPTAAGVDCRFYTVGGGTGSSNKFSGAEGGALGNGGNGRAGSYGNTPGNQPTSAGMLPYGRIVSGAVEYSGGGVGAGYRGGAAPRGPFQNNNPPEIRATGTGGGGSSGGADPSKYSNVRDWSSSGQVQMVFFVYMGPDACVVETTTTTLSSTETVAATSYDTVYTPSGTVTESPTVTVTNTPALVMTTTTEVVEEQAGPDYYTENVIVTTTPLISTVTVSTDVTTTPATATLTETSTPDVSTATETSVATETPASATSTVVESVTSAPRDCPTGIVTVTTTPPAATVTSTSTPAAATVSSTSVVTSTPPVTTSTAIQSVATGTAACTQYRLVYPASCCPNTYLKLTPRPAPKQRRARNFGKRATIYSTVTATAPVQTVTSTSAETQTLPGAPVTVTSTVTTQEEAPTPYTTVTATTTQTNPGPQVPVYETLYDEAETPLAYETLTSTHEAPTPFETVTETAPAPSTTVTVDSTSTLAQQTVTTTSTDVSFYPCMTSMRTVEAPTPTQTVVETAQTPTSTVTVFSTSTLAQQTVTSTTTAYSQATTCAAKTVYTQPGCPLPVLKGADQLAQIVTLNLWKAAAAAQKLQPVIVDCGSAGTFTY